MSDLHAETVRACPCGNGPIPDDEATCECCQRGHAWVTQSETTPWRRAGRYCWRCLTQPAQSDGPGEDK